MPVRERMQPQPWWDDMQFTDGKWHSVSEVMSNRLDRDGQSVVFVQALIPPAHMPTAQPVCEEDGWYWVASEGERETDGIQV